MNCPRCGHVNRAGARFCARCRTPLAGLAPFSPPPPAALPPPFLAALRRWWGPQVAGRVTGRWESVVDPPRNRARGVFRAALALLVFPAVVGAFLTVPAERLPFAALAGIAGLGCLLACLVPLAVLLFILSTLRRVVRGRAPLVGLQVADERTGRMVRVEMAGQRHGVDAAQGDVIAAWGQWLEPDRLRAWRIQVQDERGRAWAESWVTRPHSPWAAGLALILAVVIDLMVVGLLVANGPMGK